MNTYRIFTHPTRPPRAVPQGWSWPACVFSVIWAFGNGLWAQGTAGLIALFTLGYVSAAYGAGSQNEDLGRLAGYLAAIVVSVLFGIKGNGWLASSLEARGYLPAGSIAASGPATAVAAYLMSGGAEH